MNASPETAVLSEYLGLKVSTLIWGTIGGAIAAMFGPGSWRFRFATTLVGTITATAFGPVWVTIVHSSVLADFNIPREHMEPPVIFLAGLTGMWFCAIINEFLKRMRNNVPGVADATVKRVNKIID